MGALLDDRPDLDPVSLIRTRDLMRRAVPGCLVANVSALKPLLDLPDPDDRHVVAAALLCGAQTIVTFNLRDFPTRVLSPLGISVMHPDDFLYARLEQDPAAIVTAARGIRRRLVRPTVSGSAYIARLRSHGLVKTASVLEAFVEVI